jgi:hypothetical protein
MSAHLAQYGYGRTVGNTTFQDSNVLATHAGSLLVVFLSAGNQFEQPGPFSVSDGLNTFHRLPLTHAYGGAVFGGTTVEAFYAFNILPHTGKIRGSGWANNGGYSQIDVAEYSCDGGWGATDPIDTSNWGGSNGTPSVFLNLAQVNELVVGHIIVNTPANWAWRQLVSRTGSPGNQICDPSTAASLGDFQPLLSGGFFADGVGGATSFYIGCAAAFKVTLAPTSSLLQMGVGR